MLKFTLATMSLLALAPALARAEEAAAPSGFEVVVVGTPLDQSERDVLQGITTLKREDVLATLGQGLGDTLDRQPGVASTGFAAGASRPIIRGLGEDRIRVLSNGIGQIDVSTVSPDHAVTTEGLEAQKIEILRGPAAIAYGGNAVGGVVNVIDSRIAEIAPTAPLSGQLYGAVATGIDQQEIAGQVTMAAGAFVLHAEGFTRDSGDYDVPGFAFSPSARADAIAEGADANAFARGAAPNSFAEAKSGAVGVSLVGDQGFIGASFKRLESQYGFPEDEVIALNQPGAPFIDMESSRTDVRAGFNQPFGVFEKGRAEAAYVDYQHSENEEGEVGTIFKSRGFEGRVELTHLPVGGLTGVVGMSGLKTKVSAIGDEAFLTPTEVEEIGAFVVEQLKLSDALSLEGGLRLDRKTLDNDTVGERDFNTVSVSIGAGYRPTEDWFFGLTLARTERAPTELELFANGPHKATQAFEVGDPNLDKETALSIEAKARYDVGAFRIEANLFHIAFSDYIALLDTGAVDPIDDLPIFAFRQEDATFTGGELSAAGTVLNSDAFTLSADAALDIVRAELDRSGDLPRIPPLTWTLGLDATSGPFSGRIEYVATEDQDRVASFETPTPGYEVINARLSWSPEGNDRLVIFLDGRNLTDEDVREHTSFVKGLLPRPGRSVRLAVTSKF